MASPWSAFGVVSKFFQFVAKLAWPSARLEIRRRGTEEGYPQDFDLLEPLIDEAIQLLLFDGGLLTAPAKWAKFRLSDPPRSLRTPTAREWLSQGGVQQAAKEATLARFSRSSPAMAESELAESWTSKSGEHQKVASGIVQDLLAFLAASINRHLAPADAITIDHQNLLVEKLSNVMRAEFADVRLAVDARSVSNEGPELNILLDREVDRQLSDILKRRFLPGYDTLGNICDLYDAIVSGSFRGVSSTVIARVLEWRSRLLAALKQPEDARKFLEEAKRILPTGDFTVVEARTLAAEGKVQDGLRLLRDRKDIESVVTLLVLIDQDGGKEEAIKFYENNRDLFSNPTEGAILVLLEDFSQLGRWDGCQELIDSIKGEAIESSIILCAVVGINLLALAATPAQRETVLEGLAFDPSLVRFRDDTPSRERMARAHKYLRFASKRAADIQVPEASFIYEYLAFWAWLANPNTSEEARAKIADSITNIEVAVRLARLAISYNILFDVSGLRKHLAERRKLGGWSGAELEAALLCALKEDCPEQVQEFLANNRDELQKSISASSIRGLEIQAAMQAGQTESAKQLLASSTAILPEEDRVRISVLLRDAGSKEIDSLKVLFEKTQSVEDLAALIGALGRAKDWAALIPYALEMFSRTLHVADATVVCQAFSAAHNEDGLFQFLQANPLVIERSVELRRRYGWALLREGMLKEADQVLSAIPVDRRIADDRNLYVSIAIESGDWERLNQFVEIEWEHRKTRSAEDLLRAAAIALEVDSGRILSLLDAATKAAPTNAEILAAAYGLAIEAGAESEERAKWLEGALKHSKPEGPVRAVSLKQIMDMQPDWQRRVENVSGAIVKGGIPLFIAAKGLRSTLTQLLLLSLYRNAKQTDPRRRSFIPTYHAASGLRAVPAMPSVTLDLTALFVLHYLGLLDRIVASSELVIIPHGTLGQIFQDRNQARFHQPSRLSEAAAIGREVDAQRLKVLTNQAPADPQLEGEAGTSFAQLVSTAIRDHGVVVRAAPIHKNGSLGEEVADIAKWVECIFDTHELVATVRHKGLISEQDEQRALAYLSQHDCRWTEQVRQIPDGPLLLDGLTLNYLWTTELLTQVCHGWSDVRISQETFEYFSNLDQAIAAAAEGLQHIDDLRRSLQRFIASGAVKIARSRNQSSLVPELRDFPTMTMLAEIPATSAVVIDDRFMNQHATMTDARGHSIFVTNSLKMLDDLRVRAVIDDAEWRAARHNLRRAGVGVVPLEPDELRYYIDQAAVDGGKVVETQELRAIRESFLALAMVQAIDPRTEGVFLIATLATIRESISNIWKTADPAEAKIKADWLFALLGEPLATVQSEFADGARELLSDVISTHIALLCLPASSAIDKGDYSAWFDKVLKRHGRKHGPTSVEHIIEKIKGLILAKAAS